jgi:Family of unknown function (DUF5641)
VGLIQTENLPNAGWPLAVVVETFPGSDQVIRVVRVKTQTGLLVRPVRRMVRIWTIADQHRGENVGDEVGDKIISKKEVEPKTSG